MAKERTIIITEDTATKYVVNGILDEIYRVKSEHRYIEYTKVDRMKLQNIYAGLQSIKTLTTKSQEVKHVRPRTKKVSTL